MFKFNNSNIFTGYIKQLLTGFNLPTAKVVDDNIKIFFKGQLYIYNNQVIEMLSSVFQKDLQKDINYKVICDYKYNDKAIPTPSVLIPNSNLTNRQLSYIPFTKTFQNRTQNYDSYTHRYLGDYLYFLKHYKHLDLMSLYNCFSNELATNIKVSKQINLYPTIYDVIDNKTLLSMEGSVDDTTFIANDNDGTIVNSAWERQVIAETKNINFNSNDNNYKIYMVPVRFFEKYTIAIQSDTPVEVCCGFYKKSTISADDIIPDTYMIYNNLDFNKPIIYDKLTTRFDNYNSNDNLDTELNNVAKENSLRMFIKLPSQNMSSIVVLEGDYHSNNDYVLGNTTQFTKYNQSAVNMEILNSNLPLPSLLSPLQLLKFNSGISYPFADRLIEYLSHNVVDSVDNVSDNVKRIQQYIANHIEGIKTNTGIWDDMYKYYMYGLTFNKYKQYFDILGYCDKDIETIMGDVDIYPNLTSKNKGV